MTNFQNQVRQEQAFGVIGEVRLDTAIRSNPFRLVTIDPAKNIIGRFCTITAEGICEVGDVANAGLAPAGFLVDPKAYAAQGTAAGTLEPTLLLPNNTEVECLVEGDIIVELTTSANIGDKVYFINATGELGANAPADALPANTQNAYAEVVRYQAAQGAQPGLALIHVDKFPPTV